MKLKELLRFIEKSQKVILRESRWSELFRGVARQINNNQFGDCDVKYIIVDDDIYNRDYLKIEITKENEKQK